MNPSRVLRSLRFNQTFLRLQKTPKLFRTFLSEAYQCQEAWEKRLQSPLFQKVKPVEFFIEIDQKFQSENRVSALDIDIFANSVQDSSHTYELADVIHKLRNTRETTYTLDSTHHAVVKYYLKIGETKDLLEILSDRLNYGIFCDYFCYNILMDYFIEKKDYASAAKTATFMMLQEEFEHPISNALAIYSCHKYLENPDSWQEVDPATLIEEPVEEVKVRVKYIRNPYFDDHFDLWKPSDLVGKTLFYITRTMNTPLGRSCHLRGLILYRKYSEAISLIKIWKKEKINSVIHKDVLGLIKVDVPEIFSEDSNEEVKELKELLTSLENEDLCQSNLNEDIENLVKQAIEIHSEGDISYQTKLYSEWEEKRMKLLEMQLEELNRRRRLENVEKIKSELIEQERLLTFFENEEKIELQIQEKLAMEKDRYGEEEISAENDVENYVPPEIIKKRNK